jgi:beta-N-acetylhexosaminidase
MTEELRALLAEGGIGGYFITSAGADASQVRAFIGELKAAARLPLLLATDFEGGEWNFIRSAVGARPTPSAIGASGDSALAFEKGREDARLLASVGINTTFAPTIDLLLNPESPILQARTFGVDPALVTRMADAYLDGLATHGIAGCLKHFPGLGRASRDTASVSGGDVA